MANKNPSPRTRYRPGQSGNIAGKPKNILTKDKVNAVLGKFSMMTRSELQEVIADPNTPMIEITVASIYAKAATDGDYSRLDFLLDRSIGRVKEVKEIIVPKPTIIEKTDGSKIVLGHEMAAIEGEILDEGE